ncbi:SAC3/GANP/Nin1/mts3/eIF-3 p25 family-domain-containing protein [Thamnocephalis sphaerospora]|uniref:SAC3/GANP/Nin1/mts3/eIF-3 p25 family-domain-containing protein n=1 Tax=Thamnocephalis sphaerospora TaxID=78915 RepID=A0A4P9XRD0_9FUNG|nr:SAC3/GANP/Nin1/mts3/eIF-3 p25 family-domain-containing protein [Thamnocephalis sphaerospora]|eukprot:RKP08647.1 SAC3/GANP/Nin1/mts3/eIF-3 p25 family-domain-containing protein [Thamnocephalis sphaerospora]
MASAVAGAHQTASSIQLKRGRETLRRQYIEQGLLQDPEKRIDLKRAIRFVGTCQDMCPEFEREEREYQKSIDKYEQLANAKHRIDHTRAVKTFHRPAAGNEQPLPCDVRPPPVLERTLRYLIHDIVAVHGIEDTHFFVRDRMRSIRQDYTLQNERGPSAIAVHEQIARFHIACTHLLCESSGFSESQEMEQLRKGTRSPMVTRLMLQSLQEFYDDALIAGIECPNEAEFRSYYLVAHLGDKDVLRQAQYYRPQVYQSPMVQQALRFHSLYQRSGSFITVNMARFFRTVAHPATTFLTACMLEHFFINVRKHSLFSLCASVNIKQRPAVAIPQFAAMFGFTDNEELLKFCAYYGLTVTDSKVMLSTPQVQAEQASRLAIAQ